MEYAQRLIDPEGKYPSCRRRVDRLAFVVLKLMPGATLERTRDVFEIQHGGEEGISVVVTPEAVEFRLPTLEWPHPHTPGPSSRLWKRVKVEKLIDEETGEFSDSRIREFLGKVQEKRRREFRKCHYCGSPTPPEHRHHIDGKHVCHGCSEQHLGVVH